MTEEIVTHELWACERNSAIRYLEHRERVLAMPEIPEFPDGKSAFFLGAPDSEGKEKILDVVDGVASIKINGVLSKQGPSFWDKVFGFQGTAYSDIIDAVSTAADDAKVSTIRLDINSPGGEANGVDSVHEAVALAGSKKKVIAVNNGLMASAAYWIACAAQEIVALSPADETGSIGTAMVAIDRSKRDQMVGRVTFVSSNAPNKRPDLATDVGKQVLQDRIDANERVFFRRVSEGRGVSVETITEDFGKGSVLIASDPDSTKPDAVSVGMIDRVLYGFAEFGDQNSEDGGGEVPNDEPPSAAENEEKMDEKELKAKVDELSAARDEQSARMAAAAPILASDVFPAKIKEIAGKVLAGEKSIDVLNGALEIFDADKASEDLEASKVESEAAPEPQGKPQGAGVVTEDGTVDSAESLIAEADRLRAEMGR